MEFLSVSGIEQYSEEDKDVYKEDVYQRFAEVNKISKELANLGWEAYLND